MRGTGLWIVAAGTVELREEEIAVMAGEVLVEARFSGISRGTEALVLRGGVPRAERARMRAPLQAGSFPFPVKYGYAAVGRVVAGPAELEGRDVFVLHPHQDRFAAPAAMAVPLPRGLPAGRAVLAANMETALNIVWDSGASAGDRIAVVGAGMVGALAGWLCARLPGAEVTLVDVNPERAALAAALGCGFAAPEAAPGDCDLRDPHQRQRRGAGDGAGGGGARGDGGRGELVRRPAADRGARRRVSQPAAAARLEPGRAWCPTERRARWSNRRRLEAALGLLPTRRSTC